MGYKATAEAMGLLNEGLQEAYKSGKQFRHAVDGRPELQITSLDPLDDERYRILRGEAPHLAGLLVVRQFFPLPTLLRRRAKIYAVVEPKNTINVYYGFQMDSRDESDLGLLEEVAAETSVDLAFRRY
jgi:hypothetical protein